MADQNDMKVGVLADLADIEQQGVRAGEAFKKGFGSGFGPGGIGGALLGNGMTPTQGPQGPGDSVAGILEKILQSLQTGFGRMLEASGGGLGGGAATRDPGGTFFKGGYDYEKDKQKNGGGEGGSSSSGGSSFRNAAGAASMFPQQSYANMYGGGFYSTDIAKFAAAATSNIPLVGQFMGVVSDTMSQRDGALRDSLGIFRGGGIDAFKNLTGMMTGNGDQNAQENNLKFMKQYGVSRSEAAQLLSMSAQSGFSGDNDSFNNLTQLQGLYGMGHQGSNLMGSVQQGGGGKEGQTQLFATVLATAIGQNLDRGRWGEMFGVIAKSVDRMAQTGDADVAGAFGMAHFVGSMGDRFTGGSASAGSMTGMLQGMQSGQGGAVGELFALEAAGLGQPGVSYQTAWARVQRGSAKGGVNLQTVLKRLEQRETVQAYLASGSQEDLDAAMYDVSMLLPTYKSTDIEALLRSMRSKGYQDGSVFKGPAANDTSRMANALKNGKIPKGVKSLTDRDIEQGSSWSSISLGGDLEEAADAIERTLGKKAADNFRKEHADETGGTQENFPDQPEHGGTNGSGASVGAPSGSMTGGGQNWRQARLRFNHRGGAASGTDITYTPGTTIRAPVGGIIHASPGVKKDRSKPGMFVVLSGDDGEERKLGHLELAPGIVDGRRVSKGDVIGKTLSQDQWGKMPSHLHYQHKVKGKNVDFRSPNAAQQEELDSLTGGTPTPGGDRGYLPGDDLTQPPPNRAGGPVSQAGEGGGIDVNIYVYDGRISVQKTAAKGKRGGNPHQMYGNKNS